MVEKGEQSDRGADDQLKARHRAMWASGDYPAMVETFLLPLGERLVSACGIGDGQRVLDVASGTGNAAVPAARTGARVVASDLTAELLEVGRASVGGEELDIKWTPADAEQLPFSDESFDVVMSCIGAMFAPHHQRVADELIRVCRPGGTVGLLSWTPDGIVGDLFRAMAPFAPPSPPGAQPPPRWGDAEHLAELFGARVRFETVDRGALEVTAFERPEQLGAHFETNYGPTLAALANARRNGKDDDLRSVLHGFGEQHNLGEPERARFSFEYLLAVGVRP